MMITTSFGPLLQVRITKPLALVTLVTLVAWVALMYSGPAEADIFPCSTEGLDAVIAASETGNAGPHALDCEPGQSFGLDFKRSFEHDLTLDFGGGLAECPNTPGLNECSVFFEIRRPRLCFQQPECLDAPIYGPPPTVVFENLEARTPDDSMLPTFTIFNGRGGSNLTVKNVRLSPSGFYGIRVDPRIEPTVEELQAEIKVLDSTIYAAVDSGHGDLLIEGSTIMSSASSLFEMSGTVYVFSTATAKILNSTVEFVFNLGGLARIGNSTLGLPPPAAPIRSVAYQALRQIVCGHEALLIQGGDLEVSNTIFRAACPALRLDLDLLPAACDEVAANLLPPTITSMGGNVESAGDTCNLLHSTDQTNVSPDALAVGPLQDNGGPTPTFALLEASVARDAGVDCGSLDVDQRGYARPDGDPSSGGLCDSGAVEFVDCDGSGVDDGTEIAQGLLADREGDRIPDVCQSIGAAIDVLPRDDRNRIKPNSQGLIPVALLGSAEIDVSLVDLSSLAFGPAGGAPGEEDGRRLGDIDGDGSMDLLSHFRVSESGIDAASSEACLTGELFDGRPFEGCDEIEVLSKGRE